MGCGPAPSPPTPCTEGVATPGRHGGAAGGTATTIEDEVETLRADWGEYDYFFFHVKKTDSAGEDGDFERKVKVIEHVDQAVVPAILELKPDVLIVTGDHSTPSVLKSHSWHPVPTLLWSRYCLPDGSVEFGERACARGSLGTFAGDGRDAAGHGPRAAPDQVWSVGHPAD